MKNDRYFHIALLALLALDVASRVLPIRSALAADTMRCEIAGPVKVEGTLQIDTFSKPIRIDIDEEVQVEIRDELKVKQVH